MHEHYDTDGNLTGYTVITREPKWDEESRGRALRLAEYERNICGCGCGQPIDAAYNPKQAFKVDHHTCQAGRAIDQVRRKEAEEADRLNKPAGWADGRHYFATPVETPTRGEGK